MISDFLIIISLLVLSWLTARAGLIVLAIPLAVAGIVLTVLMIAVLVTLLKRNYKKRDLSRIIS